MRTTVDLDHDLAPAVRDRERRNRRAPRSAVNVAATIRVLLLASALFALAPSVPAIAAPVPVAGCFGAAARDPVRPCADPALRLTVRPSPAVALLTGAAPCASVSRPGAVPAVCAFGVPLRTGAGGAFALVGDSHAEAWRGALAPLSRATGRPGVTLHQTSCPYSALETVIPEPARTACRRWNAAVPGWFAGHPWVTTAFVSARVGVRGAIAPDADAFEAKVEGYTEAWRRLPASVSTVVILRDPPSARITTASCVERAVRRRVAAGPACALPRTAALRTDAGIVAARRLITAGRTTGRRFAVVDLSRFMCGARTCRPVVGGALVHKDVGHMTRIFAATLAPYLQRSLSAQLDGWG